jgi:hypothetical protein
MARRHIHPQRYPPPAETHDLRNGVLISNYRSLHGGNIQIHSHISSTLSLRGAKNTIHLRSISSADNGPWRLFITAYGGEMDCGGDVFYECIAFYEDFVQEGRVGGVEGGVVC